MPDMLFIILRSVIVYIFIVVAIRVFGKREISQLSVVDLVFILLISNSVQNAMVGPNDTLLGGLVAAASLFGINKLMGTLILHSNKLSRFLEGEPLMLIYQGRVLEDHLKKAQISQQELEAAVREHGVEKLTEVNLAVLEADGNISVLSANFHKHTVRKRRVHRAVEKNY